MWPASSDTHRVLWLYIGAQCLQTQVRLRARWLDDSFESSQLAWGDEDALCRILRDYGQSPAWLQNARRAKHLRVVISDHWLASASVPWSLNQLTRMEALQDARDHLVGAGFDMETGDEVRLDDCPVRQPRLAVGFPARVLSTLQELAREVRVDTVVAESLAVRVASRLASARMQQVPNSLAIVEPGDAGFRSAVLARFAPKSTRVEQLVARNYLPDGQRPWQGLAQALARVGWTDASSASPCVVLDGKRAGQSVLDAAQFGEAPWLPVDWHVSSEPLAAGTAEWLRWLGSDNKTAPGPLAVSVVSARASASGFRAAPAIDTRLGLWHFAAIASIIGGTVWFGAQAARHYDRLQSAREATADLVQMPGQQKTLQAPTVEKLLAANRAIAHLNIPLEGVLVAIQPPHDVQTGLLGVEVSAAKVSRTGAAAIQPALKIVAEAPTAGDMTRYVAYLSGRSPLTHAELLRHELTANPNSVPLYRFSVEIGWRP